MISWADFLSDLLIALFDLADTCGVQVVVAFVDPLLYSLTSNKDGTAKSLF